MIALLGGLSFLGGIVMGFMGFQTAAIGCWTLSIICAMNGIEQKLS